MSIDDRGKRQLEFHVDRRGLLRRASAGFPLLSLYGLLSEEVRAAEVSRNPQSPRQPHHAPRAKSVIFLFMGGGPSQVDLFDPKPKLADHTKIPIKLPRITRDATPNCRPSPFRFQQHGESGTWFSELLPNLSRHADDLCIVRSVYCDQIEHSGAIRQMTTGDGVLPRPSVGAWSLYGLGSENDSLPGFVSISRQSNLAGKVIHGSSFLPAAFEGTSIPDVKKPIANLAMPVAREIQATRLAAIRRLAEVYRRRREDDSRLDARLAAYELAFRMQTRAPEAFDLSRESRATQDLYGLGQKDTDEYGRQCLLARRLVERGVRFVVANVDNQWDAHGNVRDHEKTSRQTDRPVAALIADLKSRGLLDQTLVVWGGEFGRTPTGQGGGRDHHPYGFTMWLAGGGVRGGMTYGSTDEFGFFAVEDKVHVHDLHATMLHLIGLDHEALTFRYSGRDFRLTDVYGRVVNEILV
ncbi:MAG: sulfatase [Planctomycetaceae bacterium]|nr:sulfatase [Planctomycetaceae bacterium]|tara:strand:- start:3621 stop:5021 length:1401 start_codon:yes stop_codon:yes gene_type:complete